MVTGLILAAGFSKRMGEEKLLLEVDGVKLIERVIRECKNSILDEIILVYRKKEIKEIGEKYGLINVYNPNAHLGQSESLKQGIKKSSNPDAYMFIMGDQPFLNRKLINRLIQEYKKGNSTILIPCHNGKNGTPTIFSSIHKEELFKIQGDKGGRDIIKNNPSIVKKVYIHNEIFVLDIDTPEDYNNLSTENKFLNM